MHFKTQWDKADAITHKCPYNPYPTQKNHTQNHQNSTPKVDPYAMDVSVHIEKLTPQEREVHQRKLLPAMQETWPLWKQLPYLPKQRQHPQETSLQKTTAKKKQEDCQNQRGDC